MAAWSMSISRSFHSPTTSAFSSKKKERRGSWNVSVRLACIMSLLSALPFSSALRPEGISMATTYAPESLTRLASIRNPPSSGLLRPAPKRPSMTTSPLPRFGGRNSLATSVKSTVSRASRRFRSSLQSGESFPVTLKRKTSILLNPCSIRFRATARASPPLLPGPASTTIRRPGRKRAIISLVTASAALSIRSIDLMP